MQRRFYLQERSKTIEYLQAPDPPSGFFLPKKKAVENAKLNSDIDREFRDGNRRGGGSCMCADGADKEV